MLMMGLVIRIEGVEQINIIWLQSAKFWFKFGYK
jgi:hypothetical protein